VEETFSLSLTDTRYNNQKSLRNKKESLTFFSQLIIPGSSKMLGDRCATCKMFQKKKKTSVFFEGAPKDKQ
jgi:uncharacterized protein YerC